MTPEVSYYIPGSLEDTDKYIEVADGHHITVGKKSQERIKICDDNRYSFIATLHNVLLAPDLCDKLFSIINIMNSGHTYLFHKGFCTVYFGGKENDAVTFPQRAQKNHAFLGEIKEMSKKMPAKKKVAL